MTPDLTLVIGADATGGLHQRFALRHRQRGEGAARRSVLGQLAARDMSRRVHAVETTGVLQYGSVAASLHVRQYRGDGSLDALVLRALEREQRAQLRFEVRLRGSRRLSCNIG